MLADRALCEPGGAGGILSAEGVARRLWRWRLPLYTVLSEYLEGLGYRLGLQDLWRKVFGDELPRGESTFDLECELAWRVDRELFPLCLDALDDLWNSGEEQLMGGYIPWNGYHVPWEVAPMGDLDAWARPVVPVVANLVNRNAECEESANWRDAWIDERGYETPAYSFIDGEHGLAYLREGLAALQPPLDGLAAAMDLVVGETGNEWLDNPDMMYAVEYNEDYIWNYDWSPECLDELKRSHDAIRPRLARLTAYQEWFERTRGAERQVMDLLTRMVDTPWHVVDGRVIYDE